MAAGLRITAGPPVLVIDVGGVQYTITSGSPIYVPKEHRTAVTAAATAKGITLSPAVV